MKTARIKAWCLGKVAGIAAHLGALTKKARANAAETYPDFTQRNATDAENAARMAMVSREDETGVEAVRCTLLDTAEGF